MFFKLLPHFTNYFLEEQFKKIIVKKIMFCGYKDQMIKCGNKDKMITLN